MEGGIENYRMTILDDGYCPALLSYRRRTKVEYRQAPGMQKGKEQRVAVEMLCGGPAREVGRFLIGFPPARCVVLCVAAIDSRSRGETGFRG